MLYAAYSIGSPGCKLIFFLILAVGGGFSPLPLIKTDGAVLVSESERSQNG